MDTVVIGIFAEGRGIDVISLEKLLVLGRGDSGMLPRRWGNQVGLKGVGLQRDDGDTGCWPGPTSGVPCPSLEAIIGQSCRRSGRVWREKLP